MSYIYLYLILKCNIKRLKNIRKNSKFFAKNFLIQNKYVYIAVNLKSSGSASRVPFSFCKEKSGPSGAKYL